MVADPHSGSIVDLAVYRRQGVEAPVVDSSLSCRVENACCIPARIGERVFFSRRLDWLLVPLDLTDLTQKDSGHLGFCGL